MSEQNVEQIIQAMTRAPDPACEVITIERAGAETILRYLEDTNALPEHVAFLRSQLAEPKVELWAVHSVSPAEVYPSMSKKHADREAQEMIDLGRKMKAERVERGESVDHWHDWVINVIHSPWEPAEHFQILAEAHDLLHRIDQYYTNGLSIFGECEHARALISASAEPDKCTTCQGRGEIYSGQDQHFDYFDFQPPEPIMDVCPECGGEPAKGGDGEGEL